MNSTLITRQRQLIPAYGWTMEDSIAPDGSVAKNILSNPLMRQQYIFGAAGGAHGTHEASDVIMETIDGVSTNELWRQFQASVELQNRQRQPLIDFLTFTVTQPFE